MQGMYCFLLLFLPSLQPVVGLPAFNEFLRWSGSLSVESKVVDH